MAESNDSSSNMITVVVRSPKESKDVVVNGRDTVKQLKILCANEFSSTGDQLCVIYSGKMLSDSEVLSDCGVYDGATVHLVIKSAHHMTDEADSVEELAARGLAQSADVSATPFGLGALGGLSGLSSLGLGSANFMDLQQKMMREMVSHPEMMRTLLNSPFVQQIMSSPDLMRQLMSTNPQLCEVMEKNPEIMQTMADPELMKRMVDVVKCPAMLQELMRGQEHLIGGVRIPPASAPSAGQPAKKDEDDKEKNKEKTSGVSESESQQLAPESPQPKTVSELFGIEAVRSMLQQVAQNPQLMTNMLQAPYVQAMLQSISTNQSLVLQMLYNSPVFAKSPELQQQLPSTVPFFAQQLQNPEVQKLMTNPRALHAMLLIQQGMQELYAEVPSALGTSVESSEQTSVNSAYTQYLSRMLNMAAGLSDNMTDEQKFALQLQQLAVMGFSNHAANLEALSATQGDLNSAINRLKAEH